MPGEHSQSDRRLTARQRHVAIALAVVCIAFSGVALVAAQSSFGNNVVSFEEQGQPDWVDVSGGSWDWDDTNAAVGNESVRNTQSSFFTGYDPFNYTGTVDNATFFLNRSAETSTGTDFIQFREWNGADCSGADSCPRTISLRIDPDDSVIRRDEVDGSNNIDLGFDIPDNQWVKFEMTNINYTAETFDIAVYDESGNTVGDVDGINFSHPNGDDAGMLTVDLHEGVRFDHAAVDTEVTWPPVDLNIEADGYMRPGTSQQYDIVDGNGADLQNATLSSSDNTTLTVYESNNTLVATGNESALPAEVTLTATYQGDTTTMNVTIAQPSLQNIDKLPAWWKVSALFNDERGTDTMLWLFAAVLAGITAARIASTFAGLGAYEMFVIFGWITGEVSDGVLIASLLMAIFLGLNLAANIDYSVRQT